MPNRWEDIFYTCEWLDCNSVFDKDDAFYDHVLQHVQQIIDKASSAGSDAGPTCQWCACPVEPDSQYIMRHLYYHAFHSKLMSRGAHLSAINNWPPCHADPSNRLVIPIIPSPFVCGWRFCDFQSNNVEVFYAHVDNHPKEYRDSRYPPDTLPHCQWDDCSHISTRIDHLVLHLASHTRKRVLACRHCGDMFVTSDALKEHLLRQALVASVTATEDGLSKVGPSGVQEHVCLQCGRVYASERMLRDHLRRHVNILKCEHCEMTCSSKYALKRHMQYKHNTARPYSCGSCSYSAKSSHDLLQHVQMLHEKVRARVLCCAHCDYTCKRANSLIKHERMAHSNISVRENNGAPTIETNTVSRSPDSRRYACHLCKRRYKWGKLLSHHLRTRHKLRLPPGFSKFTYQLCEDGHHRLQTTRVDSLEVIQQILGVSEVEKLLGNDAVASISNDGDHASGTSKDSDQVLITSKEDSHNSTLLNDNERNSATSKDVTQTPATSIDISQTPATSKNVSQTPATSKDVTQTPTTPKDVSQTSTTSKETCLASSLSNEGGRSSAALSHNVCACDHNVSSSSVAKEIPQTSVALSLHEPAVSTSMDARPGKSRMKVVPRGCSSAPKRAAAKPKQSSKRTRGQQKELVAEDTAVSAAEAARTLEVPPPIVLDSSPADLMYNDLNAVAVGTELAKGVCALTTEEYISIPNPDLL